MPTRAWFRGPASADLARAAAFRFDDPAGEVGVETMLVRAGDGLTFQVPLTYRDAPLDGREGWLIGTAEHSVLGRRWVYDACGDPVYARVLAHAIFTGAGQAEEFLSVDGRFEPREPSATVRGSGSAGIDPPAITTIIRVDEADPTLIVTDSVELAVIRVVSGGADEPLSLIGTWNGQSTPILLAYARG
jgi:Maltokinase N-terminal cap domain